MRNIAKALEDKVPHGRPHVTAEALQTAMREGFLATEDQFREEFERAGDKSGTCALCVIVWEEEGVYTLHIGNLGDCKAVIVQRNEANKPQINVLTDQHRSVIAHERQRIEAAGRCLRWFALGSAALKLARHPPRAAAPRFNRRFEFSSSHFLCLGKARVEKGQSW